MILFALTVVQRRQKTLESFLLNADLRAFCRLLEWSHFLRSVINNWIGTTLDGVHLELSLHLLSCLRLVNLADDALQRRLSNC